MSYNVIGGADGPTSIIVGGEIGNRWLNVWGLVVVILLLLPNIIYAIKFRDIQNQYNNRGMNLLEQIGRYASMFFMIFHIGIAEFGFLSIQCLLIYIYGNLILLVAYWITWLLFFIKQQAWKSMALAVIPTLLFLVNGLTQLYIPLIISAVLFGVGHVYITYKNIKKTF